MAKQEITVREAYEEDSPALLRLQAACIQGRNLKLAAQNSPTFFSRTQPYHNCKIYVALYNGEIAGSAACAVSNAVWQNQLQAVGYGFQFLTAPQHRGRGIARLLNYAIEEYLLSQDVSFYYMLISKDNLISQKAMGRLGLRPLSGNIATIVLVRQSLSLHAANIRPVTPADYPTISRLINATWHGCDLYQPLTPTAIAEFIAHTKFSPEDFLLLEEAGEVVSCAAIWRWSEVTRQRVESVNLSLRFVGGLLKLAGNIYPMPQLPKPGEYLRQWCLLYPGYTTVGHYHNLLYHLNNRAFAEGIEQIFIPDNTGGRFLQRLWHTEAGVGVHYKYLKPVNPASNPKPLHISMLDL